MNLHIRHLARWGCGKLISLHAERVHGLTPGQSPKLSLHEVRFEAGEIEGGQVVQVVPEEQIPFILSVMDITWWADIS